MAGPTSRNQKPQVAESTPQAPQSTPQTVGGFPGGSDYSAFIWQQLGDIQKSLGALQSTAAQHQQDLAKVSGDIDGLRDRMHNIAKILYGAGLVVVVVGGITGWIFSEVWAVAKPVLIERIVGPAQPSVVAVPGAPPAPQQSQAGPAVAPRK